MKLVLVTDDKMHHGNFIMIKHQRDHQETYNNFTVFKFNIHSKGIENYEQVQIIFSQS